MHWNRCSVSEVRDGWRVPCQREFFDACDTWNIILKTVLVKFMWTLKGKYVGIKKYVGYEKNI